MAQQSTFCQSTSSSMAATCSHSSATNIVEKENLRPQNPALRPSHGPKATASTTKIPSATDSGEDSDDEDGDRTYSPPAEDPIYDNDQADPDEDADDDEDKASPVRGRTRRVSEKQAQLLEEQCQAEERKDEKARKAAKAAKKKAGEIEPDTRGPIQDDVFTSRTITNTRPTATKISTYRNNTGPAPSKFPSLDWCEDTRRDGHFARQSDNDTRRVRASSPKQLRQTFRGRSPLPERCDTRAPVRPMY
ncbi:hypothetical protein MVEN_00330000 [Mycena venus]|uniref:Uncharacterized protein n=1 Tax=Mycena venus TaxID=2733690 RepID=A0A8H6YNY9_9AGAR|nr:hypothetical protein MVEN_00330000 [Mycena venus]